MRPSSPTLLLRWVQSLSLSMPALTASTTTHTVSTTHLVAVPPNLTTPSSLLATVYTPRLITASRKRASRRTSTVPPSERESSSNTLAWRHQHPTPKLLRIRPTSPVSTATHLPP